MVYELAPPMVAGPRNGGHVGAGGVRSPGPSLSREDLMGLIYTLLIGLVVGAIAKMLMPGKDPGGWIITIVLGIAGAWLGTFLGRSLGLYADGQAAGWIASVVGAMILL